MKLPAIIGGTNRAIFVLACGLAYAGVSHPQQSSGSRPASQQPAKPTPPAGAPPAGQPEPPKINPQEEADYKALYDAQDPDKKIQLARRFLQAYPKSHYAEAAYDQLANAYYAKADWNDFYAAADEAISLDPKNVDMLVLEGWVIPHFYDPNDPGAQKSLTKAEDYEKRALQILPNVPNPAGMPDAQFTAGKASLLAQAHSGLAMISFQRGDYNDCVKQLSQALHSAASPDEVDLYVMGIALEKLKRYGDAADSFRKCAQLAGSVQLECKQGAERAHSEAGQGK